MKRVRRLAVSGPGAYHVVNTPAQSFIPHAFGNKVEFMGGGRPVVLITREAYSRMYHFVDIADSEVGWLGSVERTPQGDFLIKEVFLLEQEVSAATTSISEDGIAGLVQGLIDNRHDGVDVANQLFFWGHSHVRMGTFASGQDESQMRHFQENGCPWFVRGIFNKLGRMEFTIFLWEAGVKIVDAPWAICEFVDHGMRAEIEAEFEAKVSEMPIAPVVDFPQYSGFRQPPYIASKADGVVREALSRHFVYPDRFGFDQGDDDAS